MPIRTRAMTPTANGAQCIAIEPELFNVRSLRRERLAKGRAGERTRKMRAEPRMTCAVQRVTEVVIHDEVGGNGDIPDAEGPPGKIAVAEREFQIVEAGREPCDKLPDRRGVRRPSLHRAENLFVEHGLDERRDGAVGVLLDPEGPRAGRRVIRYQDGGGVQLLEVSDDHGRVGDMEIAVGECRDLAGGAQLAPAGRRVEREDELEPVVEALSSAATITLRVWMEGGAP